MAAPALARSRTGWLAAGVLGVATMPAVAVATQSPAWSMLLAGALLLAGGFVVMAPCELQMAATLATVVRRRATREALGAGAVRASALRFAAGYLLFYAPVAAALGVVAWMLAGWSWVLALGGAVVAGGLGLAALGLPRGTRLAECRGPLYLLRSGRASLERPFAAGAAFGRYCATCCGPYVLALVLVAGATASPVAGSLLVAAYAVTMTLPFLLPVLLAPARYVVLADRVAHDGPQLRTATGVSLVALGVLLVPVAVLLAAA